MVEGYRVTIPSGGSAMNGYEAILVSIVCSTIGSRLLAKGFHTNCYKGNKFLLILVRAV